MLSAHSSVLATAALLSKHNVSQVVICPGSRNAPLAQTFSKCGLYDCYSIVDERSAAFFALGLALTSETPVAVCCTSGTAVLNMASAAAEALYQGIPLIIISADRPEAIIDQLDDQTIRQRDALRAVVKRAVHISEPKDEDGMRFGHRLLNDAISYASYGQKGPVHINIPISEPLFDFSIEQLPQIRTIRRSTTTSKSHIDPDLLDQVRKRWYTSPRRMIVIGQLAVSQGKALSSMLHLWQEKDPDLIFVSEHTANLLSSPKPESAINISNIDEILYAADDAMLAALAPDLLITIGGHILSKRLKQWLRMYRPNDHYSLSADGEFHDTFGALTMTIDSDPTDFIRSLLVSDSSTDIETSNKNTHPRAYTQLWAKRNSLIKPLIPMEHGQWSDLDALGLLWQRMTERAASIPMNVRWHLHLGNSSTIRNIQHFTLPIQVASVQCNRGTSGIDGSLSTAVGAAAWLDRHSHASDTEDFILCIIGDLSFFYDMNALWYKQSPKLRILLINNGGGQIFHTLPGLKDSSVIDQYISHKHNSRAEAWAISCGLQYQRAVSAEGLISAIDLLLDPSATTAVLIEVSVDTAANIARLKEYYHTQCNV